MTLNDLLVWRDNRGRRAEVLHWRTTAEWLLPDAPALPWSWEV